MFNAKERTRGSFFSLSTETSESYTYAESNTEATLKFSIES